MSYESIPPPHPSQVIVSLYLLNIYWFYKMFLGALALFSGKDPSNAGVGAAGPDGEAEGAKSAAEKKTD